jgi:hypothetical protein
MKSRGRPRARPSRTAVRCSSSARAGEQGRHTVAALLIRGTRAGGLSRGVLYVRLALWCVGRHAKPIVPSIRTDGSVPMLHSSQVQEWQDFKVRWATLHVGSVACPAGGQCGKTYLRLPVGMMGHMSATWTDSSVSRERLTEPPVVSYGCT